MSDQFDDAWNSYRDHVKKGTALLQMKEELREAWWKIKHADCKSMLEIGTRNGGSLWVLARALPKGSKIVALDRGERESDIRFTNKVLKSLEEMGYETSYVLGDSKHNSTIEEAAALGPFDLVHIDGDHTWEGAENDWKHYGKAAQKVTLFHDIIWVGCPHPNVVDYWKEIKGDFPHFEMKQENSKMGIGYIRHA